MFPNSILLGTFAEGDTDPGTAFSSATVMFWNGYVPAGVNLAVSPFSAHPQSGSTTLSVDLTGGEEEIHDYIRTYADTITIDDDEYTITNWTANPGGAITVSPALSQSYTAGQGGDKVLLKFDGTVKFESHIATSTTTFLDREFQCIASDNSLYAKNIDHSLTHTFEAQFDDKRFTFAGSSQVHYVTDIERVSDPNQSNEATIKITFSPSTTLTGTKDITFGS